MAKANTPRSTTPRARKVPPPRPADAPRTPEDAAGAPASEQPADEPDMAGSSAAAPAPSDGPTDQPASHGAPGGWPSSGPVEPPPPHMDPSGWLPFGAPPPRNAREAMALQFAFEAEGIIERTWWLAIASQEARESAPRYPDFVSAFEPPLPPRRRSAAWGVVMEVMDVVQGFAQRRNDRREHEQRRRDENRWRLDHERYQRFVAWVAQMGQRPAYYQAPTG